MPQHFIQLKSGWHPIHAGPPKPDSSPEFHPRPEEVLVVEIGPDYPKEPISAQDIEARVLLRDAYEADPEGATVLIRSDKGEAHFRVRAFNVEYHDMPQWLKWTARLEQTEPWRQPGFHDALRFTRDTLETLPPLRNSERRRS
jgi:hypothetical protein